MSAQDAPRSSSTEGSNSAPAPGDVSATDAPVPLTDNLVPPETADATEQPTLTRTVRSILLGKPRDLGDRKIFHHLSLVAFLAWVGLGADAGQTHLPWTR